MILPISKLPAKVLRGKNRPLTFPLSKSDRKLILDMLDTVKAADGIGLAATQVGKDLTLALIYLEEAGVPPFVLINPKIKKSSKEKVRIEEGCLSLPGVFGYVSRPKKVTIEAYDMEGKKITLTDDDWIARVMQHEIDHLEGVLIVDHIDEYTNGTELLSKYGVKK